MLFNSHKLFVIALFSSTFILALVVSSPVPKTSPYENFIEFLTNNNCSMPKEIKLPFSNVSDPSPFNYLPAPLNECRSLTLKKYDETNMLCIEIFDVLKNISCERYNEPLPSIETEHLSKNVCLDFERLKDIIPKRDNYLSGRLSDELTCKIFCSAEEYEPLCTTLLWSYNTLLKIQNVLSGEAQIQGNTNQDKDSLLNKDFNEAQIQENEVSNQVSSVKDTSAVKSSLPNDESEQNSQNMKKTNKSKVDENLSSNEGASAVSNPNQTSQEPKVTNNVEETNSQVTLSKKASLNSQKVNEVINQTISNTKSLENKSQSVNQKVTPEAPEKSINPIESKNVSDPNIQPEHQDDTENKIVDEKLPKKVVNNNNNPDATSSEKSLISNVNGLKNIKNETESNLLNSEKDNVKSKAKEKSAESIASDTENNDNEVKNTFPEEDKSKTKQADVENKEIKETQKQTDYEEGPNEVLPDNDSKLLESSTQLAIPDEDVEHPDQDQYNDESEDYANAKPEYGNSFNLPGKNKEPEVKNPIPVSSNQLPNGYDGNINARNNIGQISEEIAVIGHFPEQEDSHFFFYFLSIVLIIMAGYLIFHNKQKIIALIVEGRHERRRRSHGAGYKKLETK